MEAHRGLTMVEVTVGIDIGGTNTVLVVEEKLITRSECRASLAANVNV
jgi:N-acetylglucosamine kinase-like BadF-type ATPase